MGELFAHGFVAVWPRITALAGGVDGDDDGGAEKGIGSWLESPDSMASKSESGAMGDWGLVGGGESKSGGEPSGGGELAGAEIDAVAGFLGGAELCDAGTTPCEPSIGRIAEPRNGSNSDLPPGALETVFDSGCESFEVLEAAFGSDLRADRVVSFASCRDASLADCTDGGHPVAACLRPFD